MGQPSIYHATVALSFQIEICNLDRTKSSFLATSLYKKVIFTKNWVTRSCRPSDDMNFSSCRNYWGGGGAKRYVCPPNIFIGGGGGATAPQDRRLCSLCPSTCIMLCNSLLTKGKIRHISVPGMWWLTKILFQLLTLS